MSLIGCKHTLSDVTVAPGIAYTVSLQRTANRVYSRLMDLRLAPNDGSLRIHADVTALCSNAFKNKIYKHFSRNNGICQGFWLII